MNSIAWMAILAASTSQFLQAAAHYFPRNIPSNAALLNGKLQSILQSFVQMPIVKDACHPGHSLFSPPTSGRRSRNWKLERANLRKAYSPLLSDSWANHFLHFLPDTLPLLNLPHPMVPLLWLNIYLHCFRLHNHLVPFYCFALVIVFILKACLPFALWTLCE